MQTRPEGTAAASRNTNTTKRPALKLKTLKQKRHSPFSGTAPLSLLNSCTDPGIAWDQFYTLKTGNDSNAKALRMLVFSWRQVDSHSQWEISDAKKSARSLIWRFF
ncbi:hypothetical protein ACLBW8_04245 [Pseudomonas sp. M5A4_2d]